MSLAALPATELAQLIGSRQVSAREAVESSLARIAEREDEVNAWATRDDELALRRADRLDRGPIRGPLHGVPVAVKDLIDTADLPTEYGSSLYAGHRPERDAALVESMCRAGAIVLGKSVTSELALFAPGPTRNPLDTSRSPGASSAGSAAAVADHMVPLGLGTQTLGSVVRPASYCGVVGFKPSFGRWDMRGVRRISPSLDTPGIFARSFADVALALSTLDGTPSEVPFGGDAPRLAVVRPAKWHLAEPATTRALDRVSAELGDAQNRAMPKRFDVAQEAALVVVNVEAATTLAGAASRPDVDEAIARYVATGRAVGPAERDAALHAIEQARGALPSLLDGADAIVTAATTGEAPSFDDGGGDPVFCQLWSALGCPAVAVPADVGPTGMPVGVQVVGPPGSDLTTLAAAAWLGERLGTACGATTAV